MDSANIGLKSNQVKPLVIKINCDKCGKVRSRRRALTSEINGQSLFLCENCCRETSSGAFSDPYGWNDFWLLYVELRGGAA